MPEVDIIDRWTRLMGQCPAELRLRAGERPEKRRRWWRYWGALADWEELTGHGAAWS